MRWVRVPPPPTINTQLITTIKLNQIHDYLYKPRLSALANE